MIKLNRLKKLIFPLCLLTPSTASLFLTSFFFLTFLWSSPAPRFFHHYTSLSFLFSLEHRQHRRRLIIWRKARGGKGGGGGVTLRELFSGLCSLPHLRLCHEDNEENFSSSSFFLESIPTDWYVVTSLDIIPVPRADFWLASVSSFSCSSAPGCCSSWKSLLLVEKITRKKENCTNTTTTGTTTWTSAPPRRSASW